MIKFVKKQYLKMKEPIAFISSVISIVVVFTNGNKIFRYIFAGIVLIYLLMVCSFIVKTVFDINKAKNALERKFSVQNKELVVISKVEFCNYYGIEPSEKDDLHSACEGRIIRSLSGKKQKYYAVNILAGLK